MMFLKIIAFSLIALPVWAAGYGPGGPSSTEPSAISQTQSRRSGERFNIIDWIRSNQAARAAQDAKYGRGGSSGRGPFTDFVLSYRVNPTTLARDGETLGKYSAHTGKFQFLLDDLFSSGNKTRTLNTDLGFEVSYTQTKDFTVQEGGSQARFEYKELSGALLIRPIGKSSQDSGLILKGGYLNIDEQGFWFNSSQLVTLYAPYFGAEVKLYLFPFLGLRAEYDQSFESQVGLLGGKWKTGRFLYGAFLEIYLLNLEAYIFSNDSSFTPDGGTLIKEQLNGTGFSATLFF
jgi:hypothetical protein